MKVKLSEFNAYLEKQIGQPYLWGGQHTKLTPQNYSDVIDRREEKTANRVTVKAYCARKFKDGATVLYAYDCSGLGMYYLENVKKIYPYDLSANGMMGLCKIVNAPKRGYWVFRLKNGRAVHIGYMISDTEVIHAKGRAYGVVKERYTKSAWSCIGIPKCVDFEPDPQPTPEPTHKAVLVKGKILKNGKPQKSVNVRSGNGPSFPIVGVAHSEDTFPSYGQEDAAPHWYKIDYNGKEAYITCNSRYTEEIYKV